MEIVLGLYRFETNERVLFLDSVYDHKSEWFPTRTSLIKVKIHRSIDRLVIYVLRYICCVTLDIS